MTKKIVSLLLCFILVLTMTFLPTNVFAETGTTFTVTADKTNVSAGDTVKFTITMGAVTNLNGVKVKLRIPEGLTFVPKSGKLPEGIKTLMNVNNATFTESTFVLDLGDSAAEEGNGYTSTTSTKLMEFECTVNPGVKGDKQVTLIIAENDVFEHTEEMNNIPFTITPSGLTITLPASTIKINSYQSKTYNGQVVSDPTDITKTGSAGAVTFAYYDNEACTTPLSEAPKNAGNYWVKATVAGDESHEGATSEAKAFTIEKADYAVNEGLLHLQTNVSVGNRYPQNVKAEAEGVTLPRDLAETVEGTISWYTDSKLTQTAQNGKFEKVGKTTLYYTFIPADTETNYVNTPKTGKVTFNVTALPLQEFTEGFGEAVSKTYGDDAFNVPAATTQGGEISYKSGNEKVATVNEKTGEVTIVGAGEAVITATAAEVTVDEQKYAATEKSYTLTVAQKKLTNKDLLNKSGTLTKEYDGSKNANQLVKFEVNPDAMVKAEDKVEVDYHAEFNSKDVDSADKITVNFEAYSGAGYENYTLDVSNIELTEGVAITAKPVTVVVDAAERPYGQANPSFTGALKKGSALAIDENYEVLNMQYSSAATETSPVGEYDVTGTSSNKNYAVTVEGSKMLEVKKAEPTANDFVLRGNDTISYDANTHAVTANAKSGIEGMGAITVKYNGESELPKNAGIYKISIDVAGGTNYLAKEGIELGTFVIEKKAPTATDFTFTAPATSAFDGKAKYAQVVPAAGIEGMGNISVKYNGETTAPSAIGTYTVTITVAAGTNYTAAESLGDAAWTFEITKGTVTIPTQKIVLKAGDKNDQTVDLAKFMPKDAGTVVLEEDFEVTDKNDILKEMDANYGKFFFMLDEGATAGQKATVEFTLKSDNYTETTVLIEVAVTDLEVPAVEVKDINVEYAPELNLTPKGTSDVEGTFAWSAGVTAPTTVARSGNYEVTFTPKDTEKYATVTKLIKVTITPAKVTGTLEFRKVTTAGTTLGDIKPTDFTKLSQQGTFTWNDGDAQAIEQGKAYGWTFTPTDENYAPLTGTVTPWAKSSGGSSGDSASVVTTPEKTAKDFVKSNMTANGSIIKNVDKDNYKQVLDAAEKYDKLSTAEKAAVDKEMKAQTGKTMAELKAEAEAIKASIGASTFDVQKAVKELTLKARSAKMKSGNIKITLKGDISEFEKNGYTVKYKFYRSTKKAKGYKATVTKDAPNYLNTVGKKGKMYYYKARVMVYDKDGSLVAKTELKQCKYANRKWTKK